MGFRVWGLGVWGLGLGVTAWVKHAFSACDWIWVVKVVFPFFSGCQIAMGVSVSPPLPSFLFSTHTHTHMYTGGEGEREKERDAHIDTRIHTPSSGKGCGANDLHTDDSRNHSGRTVWELRFGDCGFGCRRAQLMTLDPTSVGSRVEVECGERVTSLFRIQGFRASGLWWSAG